MGRRALRPEPPRISVGWLLVGVLALAAVLLSWGVIEVAR